MKAQKYVLQKQFDGEPKDDDFLVVEEDLPEELNDNEVLIQALYLSVDPYMRMYVRALNPPFVMIGEQVSKVIKSKNEKFPVGAIVTAQVGWRSHYLSKDGKDLELIKFELGNTSPSYCIGVLGMPGATAYFGLKLFDAKPGETMVINGAAGAVGSTLGQLCKIKGIKTIGFVGSDDKVQWCKDLGFDHVFNYKKNHFSADIASVAPNGVELFFDNVGGEWYHTIINKHLKKYGRAVICGSIENYNEKNPKLYPATNFKILGNELRVQGLYVSTYLKDYGVAFTEMHEYIKQGKLTTQETVYDFQDMRNAFYGLFKGENTGKAIVKYTPK